MDEAATKEELRPVKKQLKDLKLSGEDMPREKKVTILKDSLSAIGRRIEVVLKAKAVAGEDTVRWKRHLWTYVFSSFGCSSVADVRYCRFVTLFWPKKVKPSKLEEIHGKMVMKESSGAKQVPEIPKKSGGKVNGSTNGKSVR